MQSLRDKNKKKPYSRNAAILIAAVVVIALVARFVFPGVGNGFRSMFGFVWKFENNASYNLGLLTAGFRSKETLQSENTQLKSKLEELQGRLADDTVLETENTQLKALLGRTANANSMVLATILLKPGRSLYDTLVIDAGKAENILAGAKVYAYGDIPIGTVSSVGAKTSVVTLFSTSGQKTAGRIQGQNIDVELVGRGGGNFQVEVPRNVVIEPNANVVIPGADSRIVATVAKSITDPRDPTQTFLLTSPVNVNDLDWVQVEK